MEKSRAKPKNFKTARVRAQGNFSGALRMAFTYFALFIQPVILLSLYAFIAYFVPLFFYASLALTALTALFITAAERPHAKCGWLLLMLFSCGCGYIIYLFANRAICYGGNQFRFRKLYARSKKYSLKPDLNAAEAVKNDCAYLYNAGGFTSYTGTKIKYFGNSLNLAENLLARIQSAENFIFLEFFILADGAFLQKLLTALQSAVSRGVEVRLLYDDLGCQGLLSPATKKKIKNSGITVKNFSPLLAPFSFGLNFRDHRKVVVIDGKTAYTCGFNVADECINARENQCGIWKDSGLRLDGCAVDGMTLTFLRQWDFAVKSDSCWEKYLNLSPRENSQSVVTPFCGGPDTQGFICREAYLNAISGAREKIYLSSPYLVPDGGIMELLKRKSLSGADVRLVLPQAADWKFVYSLTRANAASLLQSGVKIYFAQNTFAHGKVLLTENCAIVGSVNMDMRSFYLEFDNAVLTDDRAFMQDAETDFLSLFSENPPATQIRRSAAEKLFAGFWKIFAPLM